MGFMGTGLFISELVRNRYLALQQHADELGDEVTRRQDAEGQLQVLVESSPAAIVTIGLDGKIHLSNEAAQRLLAPDSKPLRGQSINAYLPALQQVVQTQSPTKFRTALQCTGQRNNGEVFLAGVWFSTYNTLSGRRLAAIVVDLSEDLRNREDLSLDHLLKSSRILMSAVAHEIRCSTCSPQESFAGKGVGAQRGLSGTGHAGAESRKGIRFGVTAFASRERSAG